MGEGRAEGEANQAADTSAGNDQTASDSLRAPGVTGEPGAQLSAPSKKLSFERAEFDAPGAGEPANAADLHCQNCDAALSDEYYLANDQPLCQRCHRGVLQQLSSGAGGNLLAALAWGSGGALLGAGLYYAVSAITGYEIGLVAIVVGILVGKGVRKGAGLQNHWLYRALGLVLTYVAIVSTYMPDVVQGLTNPTPSAELADGTSTGPGDQGSATAPAAPEAEPTVPKADATAQAVVAPLALVFAFVLCLVAPVFMLMEGEIMGLIILAIGLWEGYKLSAGPKITMAGPFKINVNRPVQSPTT